MNNPCLFKYIAVISVLPVFVLFFVVNKTPKVNVVVVNSRPAHGHGLMSTDRPPLFYEKNNEADDHGRSISKGKIILIIISA